MHVLVPELAIWKKHQDWRQDGNKTTHSFMLDFEKKKKNVEASFTLAKKTLAYGVRK